MDIHTCCAIGNLERLRTLIAEGALINEKDRRGCTPLHGASKKWTCRYCERIDQFSC
jgi:hypothetical protein